MGDVRWRDGWEHRCADCKGKPFGSWWPLTEEFWDRRNMARCRACTLAIKRVREKKYEKRRKDYLAAWRRDAAHAIALYNRDYYEANKERILVQVAEYAEAHKDEIRAKRRERYIRQREERSAQRKAYYAANREVIKAKAKARYYAKKSLEQAA